MSEQTNIININLDILGSILTKQKTKEEQRYLKLSDLELRGFLNKDGMHYEIRGVGLNTLKLDESFYLKWSMHVAEWHKSALNLISDDKRCIYEFFFKLGCNFVHVQDLNNYNCESDMVISAAVEGLECLYFDAKRNTFVCEDDFNVCEHYLSPLIREGEMTFKTHIAAHTDNYLEVVTLEGSYYVFSLQRMTNTITKDMLRLDSIKSIVKELNDVKYVVMAADSNLVDDNSSTQKNVYLFKDHKEINVFLEVGKALILGTNQHIRVESIETMAVM